MNTTSDTDNAVESALSSLGYEADSARRYEDDPRTYFVTLESGEKAVLKFVQPETRAEPLIIRAVADSTDVPIPRVLGLEISNPVVAPNDTAGYFLMTEEPGSIVRKHIRNLPTDTLEALCRQAGRYLAAIHDNTRFESHGTFEVHEESLGIDSGSWRSIFESTIVEPTVDELAETRFSSYTSDVQRQYDEYRDAIPSSPDSVLVHHDYRLGNMPIRTDEGEITSILKWGYAFAGHARYEAIKCEYHLIDKYLSNKSRREHLRDAFYSGYCERRTINRSSEIFARQRTLYRTIAIANTLAMFGKWEDSLNAIAKRLIARRYKKDLKSMLE